MKNVVIIIDIVFFYALAIAENDATESLFLLEISYTISLIFKNV